MAKDNGLLAVMTMAKDKAVGTWHRSLVLIELQVPVVLFFSATDHLSNITCHSSYTWHCFACGVLPKRYRVPTMDDLNQDELAGGRVDFLDLLEECVQY
ncbi:hypothetical protein ACET3Z_006981 [Daucus carota]